MSSSDARRGGGRVSRSLISITIGYLLVVLIMGVAAFEGVRSLTDGFGRFELVVTQNSAKAAHITNMEEAIRARMLLVYELINLDDPFEIDAKAQGFSDYAGRFIAARDQLLALDLTPEQRKALQKQRDKLGEAQLIIDGVVERALSGDNAGALTMLGEGRVANEAVLATLHDLRLEQQRLAEVSLAEARRLQRFAQQEMIGLTAVALVLSLIVIVAVVRRILSQQRALGDALAELSDVNEGLEQRVEARTQDLMRVRTENVRMGTELDVSRRLQRMLLPRPDELKAVQGLEIAGFMEAAEEIGGDYYDVLTHDGHVILGMGDVTGHGLESGVIMLMVQAAVRALTEHGEVDLLQTLVRVNRLVYNNCQRMESLKNLSLVLLDYHDGTLNIAGQHEDVLVLRGDKVEVIDTLELGFPVGLEPDIGAYLRGYQTELKPGDMAVLYTDGATEAENEWSEFYGLPRLIEVIERHAGSGAEAMIAAMTADIRQYANGVRLLDDLTFLVIKCHA